jgi:hypothetical protein
MAIIGVSLLDLYILTHKNRIWTRDTDPHKDKLTAPDGVTHRTLLTLSNHGDHHSLKHS